MLRKLNRILRAELRDIRVLLGEFKLSLFLFVIIVLGGAILFFTFYTSSECNQNLSFGQALHAVFALTFFEVTLDLPNTWYMQVLFFLIPIFGLAVVVDGVIRFGAALVNKQARGQKFNRDIVAIESDQDGRFIEKAKSLGIPVIIADARRSDNLKKANVESADAIIPCTADELTNLEIALDARELNPNIKVVMRMFDPELARRIENGFGIHTAFSTSALSAPIFATAAMRVNVKHSFYVGEQLLNLSEVTILPDSQLIGWSVEKLEGELGLSFVSYKDSSTDKLHPDPDLEMQAEAKILVIASLETLYRLNELNQPRTN